MEKDPSASVVDGDTSSDYEKLRMANIARNRQVMIELGLEDADVLMHKEKKQKRKRKERSVDEENKPARRSKRLAQIPAEQHVPLEDGCSHSVEQQRRSRRASQGSRIVGTASYEHTLMRVRSMSEGALWTRMKRIESARGRHAVTKMRLFAQVCYLEGYLELAEACSQALERLREEME